MVCLICLSGNTTKKAFQSVKKPMHPILKKLLFLLPVFWILLPPYISSAGDIHEAAKVADLDRIRDILAQNPREANSQNIYGMTPDGYQMTPLHWAARMGHLDVAKLLLRHGALVGSRTSRGMTPLHMAAFRGHASMTALLLDNGATVTATDSFGASPLHLAAISGSVPTIQTLLSRGAPIDAPGSSGATPLIEAIHQGKIKAVFALASAGADLKKRDNAGETVLHAAVQGKQAALVTYFLSADALKSAVTGTGRTPLHLAAHNLWPEGVQLLLEAGAPANALDNGGDTPLLLAGRQAYWELSMTRSHAKEWISLFDRILSLFLSHRSDLEIKAKDGTTIRNLASFIVGIDRFESLQRNAAR